MNRDTIIRVILAAVLIGAIVFGWPDLMRLLGYAPLKPSPTAPTATTAATAPTATTAATGSAGPVPTGSTGAAKPEGPKAPVLVAVGAAGAEAAKPIRLGSDTALGAYDMALEVDPKGAAVRSLTLSRARFFRTVVDRQEPADEREPMVLIEPGAPPAFTIPEVRVRFKGLDEWSKIDLSNVVWDLTLASPETPSQAVAKVTVTDEAGKTLFVVYRQYTVFAVSADAASRKTSPPQYQMKMKLKFLSIDPSIEKLAYTLAGPPAMPADLGRGGTPGAVVGKWKGDAVAVDPSGELVSPANLKPGEPLPPVKTMAGPEVAWVAEMDKYFAVVVIPRNSGTTPPGVNPHDTFAAGADAAWYPVTTGPTSQAMPHVQLVSRELVPQAGKPIEHEYVVYAGPKDDGLLDRMYGPLNLKGLIAWASPCCGVPVPGIGFLSRGLVYVLEFFHDLVRNYGLAIMLLVVMLRLALHPITRWSTKSMLEMQKLGPKMQEIREKHADDQQKMREEMQKMGGFKAMGGCLPMFLQMPIWISLYTALYVAIQLRHASFIPADWLPTASLFLQDLSAPDSLVHWQTPLFLPGTDIPMLGYLISGLQGLLVGVPGVGLTSFNILPVLMGVSMYLQQKFAPQPATTNPQMASQRKMMNLMSVFFALMLYSAPAGLNLYIATSTALGLVEQRYIKRRIARMDAEKAAADAVAAKPGAPPDPQATAKAVSAVVGRKKSLGEQLRAWVEKKIEDGRQAQGRDRKDKRRR